MKRILMIFVSLVFIICLISCNEEEKVEEINIKFVIEENIYDIKKEVNYIVNIDDIPNINEEDIEGIYYDSNYSCRYNNEVLDKDTILYVRKVKENIEVTFIVGDIEEVVTMKGNSVVSLDNIPNISEEDIEGIYYDKEYTSEYKGEKLKKDTTIVIKFTKEKELYIEACYAYFNEYIKPNRKDASIYDLKVKKYFGIFSNSIVASFEDKKAMYLDSVYVTQIFVYKEREIYNLIEAYFMGIISEDDLKRINEINN